MRHDDQVRAELLTQYDALTAHIAAVDRDMLNALDGESKLVFSEKRQALDDDRRRVVDRLQALSVSRDVVLDGRSGSATAVKGGRGVEYEELMRMLYEIKTDVAIMKRQFEEHLGRCDAESAEFPPQMLTFLVVGGVVTFLLLMFVVIKIGMPG